jgi:hypothetical protein
MRAATAASILLIAAYGAGCGGGGNDPADTAVFLGDVASVTGASTASDERPRTLFAWRTLAFPSLARAQSTCAVPDGGRLLFCVNDICSRIDPDLCDFRLVVPIEGGVPTSAALRFIDDDDADGEIDLSERDSVVTQSLLFCTGDEIDVPDAAIDFATRTTAALVTKVVDGCAAVPTATSTAVAPTATAAPPRGGTATPTPTPTATP